MRLGAIGDAADAVHVGVFYGVSLLPVDAEIARTLSETVTVRLAGLDSVRLVSTDDEATWVITGEIQRIGDVLRISANLVDTRDGSVVSTLKVNGSADQTGRLQGEIADKLFTKALFK